ncbi:uncharacterized protein LOC127455506 [Myxocyprinus asiaticus]|uniref:uncharacterized protein LOC127455506 n=1 Tax=Myxocyprinus asiaticus TaxID=70543 RepID=UPI002221F244|nr:uncharacterized protein LOC127455506 [Myxocyprinus asiaticus]
MINNQCLAAAVAICALSFAVIHAKKKKKKKRRRVWTKPHLRGRGQYGLEILQRQLELNDKSGFRELLRMTADEFEFLLERVSPLISKQNTKLRKAITARDRLSITLRYLATGETFTSLAFQYCIGRSTVSCIVTTTCEALHLVLKDEYLKTPTSEDEWRTIAKHFFERWQFPNCLGALDGKQINIQPPYNSGSTYYNNQGHFSVVLTAVADARYYFTYVYVGCQSRLAETGIFAHSDLRRAMDEGHLNVPQAEPLPNMGDVFPYMFVGDDAFPLRADLMKPYSSRQLDHDERVFNYRLSRARSVVENAFGIMANRLRVFRTTICLKPEKVVKVTLASLCIHNYLIRCQSDAYMPPMLADWENAAHEVISGRWRSDGPGTLQDVPLGSARNPSQHAKDQRDKLKQYFVSPMGQMPWQENHI